MMGREREVSCWRFWSARWRARRWRCCMRRRPARRRASSSARRRAKARIGRPRRPSEGRQVVKEGRENADDRHRARTRGLPAGPERRHRVNTWSRRLPRRSSPSPRSRRRSCRSGLLARRRAPGAPLGRFVDEVEREVKPIIGHLNAVSRDASRAAALAVVAGRARRRAVCSDVAVEDRSDDRHDSLGDRQAGPRGPRAGSWASRP